MTARDKIVAYMNKHGGTASAAGKALGVSSAGYYQAMQAKKPRQRQKPRQAVKSVSYEPTAPTADGELVCIIGSPARIAALLSSRSRA